MSLFSDGEKKAIHSFLDSFEEGHSNPSNLSFEENSTPDESIQEAAVLPIPRKSATKSSSRSRKKSIPIQEVTAELPQTGASSIKTRLLTDEEKRANHIESEKKRRLNIKLGLDQLVELVPTLNTSNRSEAVVLQRTLEYLEQLVAQKEELRCKITEICQKRGIPFPNDVIYD